MSHSSDTPGWWPSPLSSADVARPACRPTEVQVADGAIYWSEGRPAEGGRVAVVGWTPERGAWEAVPPDADVRTRVNEYGGGAWRVGGGVLYASLRADARIWAFPQSSVAGHEGAGHGTANPARPLTAATAPDDDHRYADLQLTPDGRWLVCVRQRSVPSSEPLQELVALSTDDGSVSILAAGSDFVADPRISPDGAHLAWLTWRHPDMPWDATQLWAARLERAGGAPNGPPRLDIADPRVVAGGRLAPEAGGMPVSVSDAAWGPNGALWFASDAGDGFWGAMACPPGLPECDDARPVAPGPWEVAQPHWVFGRTRIAPLPGGGALLARRAEGRDTLVAVGAPAADSAGETGVTLRQRGAAEPARSPADGVPLAPEITQVETLAAGEGPAGSHTIAAVVAGLATGPQIRWWAADDLAPASGGTPGELHGGRLLRGEGRLPVGEVDLAEAWISVPQHLTFPTGDGGETHGLYYPPRHPDHPDHPEPSCVPPLVVRIHGGPTAAAECRYRSDVQFWTTRGFAVVDVNYRGSTGYGRAYRDALKGRWGDVDVADCVAVAQGLADRGLADPDRLYIRGGSAGGFTALAAVAFHDTFAAAASSYGVADLALLAAETHKFESRYLDSLVGPYPEAAELYEARSPAFHTDGVAVPVLVLQGSDDPVVPPSQADALIAALERNGVRVEQRRYDGEAHGWRRAETIADALDAELEFFRSVDMSE
ncbi:MAG: prolyl oligopeptidase family serine peptidase [Microthrixaceae bacterium]